ncbi:MAG: hypothetical protein R2794_06680 [Chitinophagales bacterium]
MMALFSMSSLIIFPPDFSNTYPVYSPNLVMLCEFGMAMYIGGLTLLGIKLAEEKQTMAAAGFTMLAISTGVTAVSFLEIAQIVSEETYIQFYYVFASGNFLFIPAMLLISTYAAFRKWIRIIGLVAAIPLLTSSFLFLFGSRNFHMLENISNTGFMLMFFTQLLWAYNVLINYKQKVKHILQ